MDRKEELILAKQLRACRVSILPRVRGGGGGQEGGAHPGQAAQGLQGLHPAKVRNVRGDMDRKEELILAKQLRASRVSILPRVRGGRGGQEGGAHPGQAAQGLQGLHHRVRGGGGGQEGGAHPGQAAQGLQGLHPTQGKRRCRWTWTGRRSSSWPSSSGPAGSPSYPG